MSGLGDGCHGRNLIGEERTDHELGAFLHRLLGGLPRPFRIAMRVLGDELNIGLVEIEKRKLASLLHRFGDLLSIHIARKRQQQGDLHGLTRRGALSRLAGVSREPRARACTSEAANRAGAKGQAREEGGEAESQAVARARMVKRYLHRAKMLHVERHRRRLAPRAAHLAGAAAAHNLFPNYG